MHDKSSSTSLRWLAFFGLALASAPLGWSWWSAAHPQPAAPPAAESPEGWTDVAQLEAQMKPGTDDAALADLGRRIGATVTWNSAASRDETDVADIAVPEGASAQSLLDKLRADPRVEAADQVHFLREPDTEAAEIAGAVPDTQSPPAEPDRGRWKPNDPRYGEQWNFRMVKSEEAWEVTKGKGAVVAVIDTGVAYKDTRQGKRARDFGDTGFVPGYDFVNRNDTPNDDQGHGTHVAGTIAESTDNGEGVAGLAFEAKIMPLKVLNSGGSGRTNDIAEAIRWAADHGANVINMSLGGPFPDSLMSSACEYAHKKGVTIVCAAGNSGREGVGYPAAYKECIAVSAVGPKGDLSFYSSWGRQVAIAAPGGDKQVGGDAGGILQNTVMPGDNGQVNDDYFAFQGTSMASPHVAAVAAMVVAEGVKNPDDVKAVLQKSAQRKGPSEKYGAGILDAAAAVKLAAGTRDDAIARFWMVVCLFAFNYGVWSLRRKKDPYLKTPFWGTAAFAFGLLFPDWLTGLLGQTSIFNLIGHSVLIPGALLVMGANGKKERRLLGLMALGLTLHVGWEFLHNTAPFGPEAGLWQLLPWVAMNVVVGLGMLISGLSARD
jgi:serine protease